MSERVGISVWAPRARTAELVLGDELRPMTATGDGWFTGDALAPGVEYSFSLDGGEPLPDPRSHRQPHGVFGPSQVVDHDAFPWTDDAWRGVPLAGSVIYELHIGAFSDEGTFDGAIAHLDHLVDLGVDLIEVMPVNAFDGDRGWGYDGVLLYAVQETYGGPEGFKRFVDAAHSRGLGVLLDVVYNHFGPTGNHLQRFGPYTNDRHQTPWGDAVNLDGPDSATVRRFFLDNAQHWLRHYHLDGLRLDAVHQLIDDSERHFLRELSEEIDALATHLRRPLSLVAEYPRTDPLAVTAREAGGHGLTAEWSDELHHSLHSLLSGERDGYYARFGSVDDVLHALEAPKDDLPRHRFVVCTQNHDQVGNRARGERLVHLVGPDTARVAAAVVLCAPFTPLLWMGEEWGASTPFPYFAGPRDDELDDAVRHGRRAEFAEFGWDPADVPDPIDAATFASARLRWDELDEPDHAAMLDWYRAMLRLRRTRPELSDPRPGSIEVSAGNDGRTITMRRGVITVTVDLDDKAVTIDG